uniref:RING-type domain-containing protein n=1 Tax=Caenorhabditis tropicalis TaxID=1561998 RepID=A0A1I7TLV8_9PELO
MSNGVVSKRRSTRERQLPHRFHNENEFEIKMVPKTKDFQEKELLLEIEKIKSGNVKLMKKNDGMKKENGKLKIKRDCNRRNGEILDQFLGGMRRKLKDMNTVCFPKIQRKIEDSKENHEMELDKLEKFKEYKEEQELLNPTKTDMDKRNLIEDLKRCPNCKKYFNSHINTPLILGCGHNLCRKCALRDFNVDGETECQECGVVEKSDEVEYAGSHPICWAVLSIM